MSVSMLMKNVERKLLVLHVYLQKCLIVYSLIFNIAEKEERKKTVEKSDWWASNVTGGGAFE